MLCALGGAVFWLFGLVPPGKGQPSEAPPQDPAPGTQVEAAEPLVTFVERFTDAMHVDVSQALLLARELNEGATEVCDPGALSLALACEAWAVTYLEGTVAAEPILEKASSLVPENYRFGHIVLELVRSNLLSTKGEYAASLEAVRTARQLASDLPRCFLHLQLALAEYWSLRVIDSKRALERCLGELRELRDSSEFGRWDAWVDLAEHDALWHDGQIAESEVALRRALEKALDVGDRYLETECYYNLGWLRWEEGRIEEALGNISRALATPRAVNDRIVTAATLELKAGALRDGNRLKEALDCIEESLELVDGRGIGSVEQDVYATGSDIAAELEDAEALMRFSRGFSATRDRIYDDENWEALVKVREELARSEQERVEAEGRAHDAERRRAAQLVIGATVVSVLLSALSIALLLGRKRLALSNARLRDEMRLAREAEDARAELEVRLRQLERLQGLGLIAGGVAHDFNNLLVGILGNAELLLASKELSADHAAMIREVAALADRAAGLCRQLLAYAGKAPVEVGPFELNSLAERVVPVLGSAVSHCIDLELLRAPEAIWIRGDATQIEQVLLNLATNSWDARAKKVTIRIHRQDLTRDELHAMQPGVEVRPGSFAVLEIEDDGDGMDASMLSHIFDPFFTTRFPGRGLGLAAVFGIIRRHEGIIDVTSSPEKGTRFRVCLPTTEPQHRSRRKPAPAPGVDIDETEAAGKEVLVVDDEDTVRNLASRMLESLDFRPVEAGSAEAALREVDRRRDRLACVLIDLSMPGKDGDQIVPDIRKRAPDCPILIMSGHSEWDVLERCGANRPDATLEKPFTTENLRAALAQARASCRGNGNKASELHPTSSRSGPSRGQRADEA